MALVFKTMLFGLGLTVAGASAPEANAGTGKPIRQHKQQRLMERFGDQGIDANGDGILTRAEVQAFHRENGFQQHRGGKRMGPAGRRGWRGPMMGPGGPLGHLLKELETLQSPTPPAWFTIERFQEADTDGNGALSAEEWTAFASERKGHVVEEILDMSPTADVDRDGQLSDQEIAILKDAHLARVRVHVLAHHPEADTDGDGVLSNAELEAVKVDRLSRILDRHPEADLNGDGTLSEEEARTFAMDRRGRPGKPFGAGNRGPGPCGKMRGGQDCPFLDEAP